VTTAQTTPDDNQFSDILRLVNAAVAARITAVQIREKSLTARVLYELATRAADTTHGSATRLLINDRFDVALAAGADGVHLTSRSLPAAVVRQTCGSDFLIGASTHSLETALAARDGGADFVVVGPVFETESKRTYGDPLGLEKFEAIATALGDFPVVAIGGISTKYDVEQCLYAGASGIAAIRLFSDSERMSTIVNNYGREF
jgi:thiamine-phosphate pyrophosphorylase